jgi:transcriptional regulator with XRE-family HTH domain
MKHQYSQIGNNIKSIRKKRGISTLDLAAQIGIGDRALTNIENGTTDLPHSRLELIAKALDMTVAELESYHQIPITNHFHQPQDKFIGVNHGKVKYEAELPKRLEVIEEKMAQQHLFMEEIRQERIQFFAFMTQMQEQMTMLLKKVIDKGS